MAADIEGERSLERMDRAGVPRPEPHDLLVDRIDVALGQQLTDAPHVPVQRQQLVADLVGDLPEFRPRRQPLRRGLNAPERVHAGVERVPERGAIPEAPRHGDRFGAEGERALQAVRRRDPGRVDDHETEARRHHGPQMRVLAPGSARHGPPRAAAPVPRSARTIPR